MFNIGDFVTFFNLDENFEHVHHDDVDHWVNGCSWYKVIEFDGTNIKVCPEWQNSYETFKVWAEANGADPSLELDRINNYDDYKLIKNRHFHLL